MTGGDPVEEGGQQVRQGFIQALQTAQMTAGLMRGRGGESRSQAESEQRQAHAEAKEQRSRLEHQVRVLDTAAAAEERATLHAAKLREVEARIANAQAVTEAEVAHKARQNERAEKDFQRREHAGAQEAGQSAEFHRARIAGYTNREARESALHDLDVENKRLRIEILRRNAGFTETLANEQGPTAARTAASTAAFAAADATAEESATHAGDADAFRDRYTADTGHTPPTSTELGDQPGDLQAPSGELVRITEGLTREAVVRGELLELGADSILDITEDPPSGGTVIDAAVDATGVSDIDPTAPDPVIEDGVDPVAGAGWPRERGAGGEVAR
ncbi:hypothetical protein [Nocardia thailandica]|uniref:hypothetical protein n=1 Tax=Nocardia thailandica TaxID=257275 RepID=UPI0002DFD4CB|nr:hypothetical protein [Nocardia thailandica]